MILVGGKGTRLRPLISEVPKPLAPIGDKPFLSILLEELLGAGIKSVHLLAGYMGGEFDKISRWVDGLDIQVSVELSPLGTGGALGSIGHHLDPSTYYLVLNGDSFVERGIPEMVHYFNHSELGFQEIVVGVCCAQDISRYGRVEFDTSTFRIQRFVEKKGSDDPPELNTVKEPLSQYINAGIYLMSGDFIKGLPKDRMCSLETEILPHLVATSDLTSNLSSSISFQMIAKPLSGTLVDIGIPSDYVRFVKYRTNNPKALG